MLKKTLQYLPGLVVLLIAILHTTNHFPIQIIDELENRLYDARIRFTAADDIDPRIIIVDIDEPSLSAIGHWPWPRDVMAQLIQNLFDEYGVEVVGLDVVFSEADEDSLLESLKSTISQDEINTNLPLSNLLNAPSRDEIYSEALQNNAVVLGYAFGTRTDQPSYGLLPTPLVVVNDANHSDAQTLAPTASRYTANLPILQQQQSGGFFSLIGGVDSDGIIRKVPLLNQFNGELYPSLSLSTAAKYLGIDITPVWTEGGQVEGYAALEGFDFGYHSITIDQDSSVYVPFRKKPRLYRYVSAIDVLNKTVESADDLFGVIGLLGTSATGLVDIRATPISRAMPGVEVHASIITGLLDGTFKSHPGWALSIELIILILVGLILIFLLPMLSAKMMMLASVLVITSVGGFNIFLWQQHNFILALAPILITTFVISLFHLLYGFLLESKSRLELKRSFGLYVPPEVVDKMQGSSIESLLQSEKKQMTVLFSDVRGFTTISENLDPAALSDLMNGFFTPMTKVIHNYHGAVDKYMGDAIMAFWGAPLDNPDHGRDAVLAAMEMEQQLEVMNNEFNKKGWPTIEIGIGLNSGPMSVGNMGSEFRMAYTVLGDAVNLGSRLEGLTKEYGVTIIISEFTAAICEGIELCELDQVRVKGKHEPVKIFTPLGLSTEISNHQRTLRDQFEIGLQLYREQNWFKASEVMESLVAKSDHYLYQMYLDRIAQYQLHPPGHDWDGVFTFKSK